MADAVGYMCFPCNKLSLLADDSICLANNLKAEGENTEVGTSWSYTPCPSIECPHSNIILS